MKTTRSVIKFDFVSVVRLVEENAAKCAQYWPNNEGIPEMMVGSREVVVTMTNQLPSVDPPMVFRSLEINLNNGEPVRLRLLNNIEFC